MFQPFAIDVRDGRAYVSRKRGTPQQFTYDPCVNWAALEALARASVEDAGGAITLSGLYPCPDALVALALWHEDLLGLVWTAQECADHYGLSRKAIGDACRAGRVVGRQTVSGLWLVSAASAEALWGQRGLQEG